eukprot:g6874.t1
MHLLWLSLATAFANPTNTRWCPSGYVWNSTICEPCPAGMSGNWTDGLVCVDCPLGEYTPMDGMMQCIGCPRGRFTDGVGFSECTACPMGRFSSSDSQSACEACAPGKYMLSTQSSECLQCERGKFSNVTAALSCEMCDPGFFSDEFPGSVSCSKCEAGRFNPRAGGRCMQCPLGTIANESGLASCQVCNLSLIWPLTSDVERVYCVTEGWVFVGCLCIMAGCSFFLILLPYAFRYRAEIEDITLDRADGRCRVIIRCLDTKEEGWILTEAAAIEAEASALYYWAKPLERTESKQRILGATKLLVY